MTETDSRWLICARCGDDTEDYLRTVLDDGGIPQCRCGLSLPEPPEDWLRRNGYMTRADEEHEAAIDRAIAYQYDA